MTARAGAGNLGGVTEGEDKKPAAPVRLPRLAGTYAAHYERGADARIGRRRLALLIVLSLLLEMGNLALILPNLRDWWELLIPGVRLLVVWSLLVALWSGAGWTRWLLALLCFSVGGWLVLQSLGYRIFIDVPGLSTMRWLWLMRRVPPALGTFYLLAAAWLAFSADLEAFVIQQRAGMTRGDRWAVGALLTLCLGLPLAGGGWWKARAWMAARARQEVYRQAEREGAPVGEFALGLMREAVRRDDPSVLVEAMHVGEQQPDGERLRRMMVAQLRTSFDAAGPVSRVELRNVQPVGVPRLADAYLCQVIVTGARRTVVFYCYVKRRGGPPTWTLSEVNSV